jgi:hypothetical protein
MIYRAVRLLNGDTATTKGLLLGLTLDLRFRDFFNNLLGGGGRLGLFHLLFLVLFGVLSLTVFSSGFFLYRFRIGLFIFLNNGIL